MSDDTTDLPALDLPPPPGGAGAAYRVLARKYRPQTFAELIGQEALVRTLTNAIRSGRLAHAFILTGVRGVGKTTTARIVARALNCVGPDGKGGPSPEPCGVCEPCRTIAGDRHMDVMEMDAASRTGVDDIRELIDGVRYGPVSARYKVYIIDEVHMLSRNAFNALLKTLEEPPPHVKFLFATTEIRKVPVTVLSRCQRFDLRRVETEVLARHFAAVAEKEGVAAEPEAIALIARAADGSVRDGLSLLDQAIAQTVLAGGGDASGGGGTGTGSTVTAAQVRDMLGLADRTVVIDLFEATVRGVAARALDLLGELHRAGADPMVVLQDLLDFTHFLTRVKLLPAVATAPGMPEAERVRGAALAAALSMPVLTRAWQMLLKGIGEVQQAPVPQAALEMVLIRLIHAAGLPTPGEILRRLEGGLYGDPGSPVPAPPAAPPAMPAPQPASHLAGGFAAAPAPAAAARPEASARGAPESRTGSAAGAAAASALRREPAAAAPAPCGPGPGQAVAQPAAPYIPPPADFRTLVKIFQERADPLLHSHLYTAVHLVRYEPGRIELRLRDSVPQNLPSRLAGVLQEWTGGRWMVSVSNAPGEPTLSEQDRAAALRVKEEAAGHPLVRAVMAAFPGASIAAVHDLTQPGEAEDNGGGAAEPAPPDEAGDE